MKNNRIVEIAVKVVVAALTAFLTALSTTSCMDSGQCFSEQDEPHRYKAVGLSIVISTERSEWRDLSMRFA